MADRSQEHIYLRALGPGDGEHLDGISDTAFRFTTGEIPSLSEITRPDLSFIGPFRQFSLAIMAGQKLVGEVIFSGIGGTGRHCRLTMGLARRSDRGQGIGSRALQLALTYAFYSLGMEKVSADTTDENPAAMASLIRAGFRLTGSETGFQSASRDQVRRLHFTITLDDFIERRKKPHEDTSRRR